MNELKVGDVIEGIVTSIKKYGVFLSFENGYVGLLHISEISGKFISNIFNYFEIGDKIMVAVKTIDQETKYLTVSTRDLPSNVNNLKSHYRSDSVRQSIKNIDFSKLDKALPKMIETELERERGNKKND